MYVDESYQAIEPLTVNDLLALLFIPSQGYF